MPGALGQLLDRDVVEGPLANERLGGDKDRVLALIPRNPCSTSASLSHGPILARPINTLLTLSTLSR